MTTFSFESLLRSLSLPDSIPGVTRAAVDSVETEGGTTVYRATLFDAMGVARAYSTNKTPESAVRNVVLGFLAAVTKMTNTDTTEDQARTVRLTFN